MKSILSLFLLASCSSLVACGADSPEKPPTTHRADADAEFAADSAETTDAGSVLDVSEEADPSCLALEPTPSVILGALRPGHPKAITTTLRNCSDSEPLKITAISICTTILDTCVDNTPLLRLDPEQLPGDLPSGDATVPPGEAVTVRIIGVSEDERFLSGELKVEANTPDGVHRFPVAGVATSECPEPIAEAAPPDADEWDTEIEAEPEQTLRLRGTSSTSPAGDVTSFEWALVKRPLNSSAQISDATSPEPSLFLDRPGEYVVELSVADEYGVASCAPSQLRVRALGEEPVESSDLRIELYWDTPTDPDDTDANGNDVDLHFLHPNGTWNKVPYDIFWSNPTNEWGAPGGADDPALTIDDTDGSGPEVIVYNGPESGLTYAIGVYYYADAGYGPAYASVYVYRGGILTWSYEDMYLPSRGAFWYVATMSWPSGDIHEVSQVQQGFPSRP